MFKIEIGDLQEAHIGVMSVSGNEKPGIKSVSRQYSASIAGIPIKKRRFPLVRSPSPPPEEQISHRNLSQDSCHSNASVVTTSSGISDASKNYFSEERRERSADKNISLIQTDANISGVNPLEPSLRIYSGSSESIASEEKPMPAEKSSGQIISGNTEPQLACKETLSLHVGKDIFSKLKIERDYEPQVSTIIGSTELSLGPKEPFAPSLVGQNSEGSGQFLEKLGSVSLNLSLSKGKSSINYGSGKDKLNVDGAHLQANRSNWDLNTTMDAWDRSESDGAACQGTDGINCLNVTSDTQDIKPLIRSDGMVVAGVASGNQFLKGSKHNPNFTISSKSPGQHYNFGDSLLLQLSPCLQPIIGGEQSGSSSKVDSVRVIPTSNLSTVLVSTGNPNMAGNVKSEPIDDSPKLDFKGSKDNLETSPIDFRNIKHELIERLELEALKNFNFGRLKLDPRIIKSEPVHEGNHGIHKTAEGASQLSGGQVFQCLDNQSREVVLPKSSHLCPSELPTCSTELPINGNVSSHSGNSTCAKGIHVSTEVPQNASNSIKQVASETVSISEVHKGKELNVSDVHAPGVEENLNVGDPEQCRLKLMEEAPLGSCGDGGGSARDSEGSVRRDGEGSVRRDGEGSVSDEEKINISNDMLEDSYESDYDSDGNHDLATVMEVERLGGENDDDYEDGEVREPLVHTDVGSMSEKREAEDVNCGDSDNKKVGFLGSSGDDCPASLQAEERDTKTEDPGETNNDVSEECLDAVPDEKTDMVAEKDACFDKSSTVEIPITELDKKGPMKPIRRKPLDRSGKKEVSEDHESELSSDKAVSGSQGTAVAVGQGIDQSMKGTDSMEKNESALPRTEVSLNSNDANKDANSGGTRSRIINLPRASYVSSLYKTRSVSGRSLPSRTVRERFTDLVPEGDKLHSQGRDEIFIDGPHKFLRERNQDQALRNSRLSFTRGRGRGSSRLDALHGDWDSDHDFAPELYNGPTDFRFRRHKTDVVDADLECSSYIIAPDGAVGTGRGGRKPLNDEVAVFRHPPSRRRSPGGREGPATRGPQMVRRIPRNISPNRCIGEDASDLVGLRHSEKFIRGLRDDIVEPVFTRQQPPFEGVEGHFVQGNRNFSSIQRRGPPRIHSKSPMRSGSPGPWSSPRRRSPDGFNGHPELTHRRSPAVYRMDRMRSPDRPCFPEEIVARRHGSPPFLPRPSNDLRDMDSARDHGPPRSVIPNRRSPSGRILLRNSRRFDIIEPRERTDSDEFFGPPMHSGRFHELGGDGSGEERRRIGERRGPVRSFRPPYNGAGAEGFRFNIEDGPRPYRFCPEADSEFLERGNLREREFDRRVKNRPGNAPRRSIEDQEGNYRHGEQVWHDQGFDDISRLKRRRF